MLSSAENSILTVNVLGLVNAQAAYGKLSVGGLGGAITTGQVVDDQSGDLVARNVLDAILDDGDLGTGVASIEVRRRYAATSPSKLTSRGRYQC
jgi:hypothetical protein